MDRYEVGWSHRPVAGFEVRSDVQPLGDQSPDWRWLVPRSDATWARLPLPSGRAFLRKFGALADPDPDDQRLLAFADEYGWLTAPVALRVTTGGRALGEPVRIWRDEAAKIRDLMATVADLRAVEDDHLPARERLWARFRVVAGVGVVYSGLTPRDWSS